MNLAVDFPIEQLAKFYKHSMLIVKAYHEKTKLAFDKKKVGKREISNFTFEDKLWLTSGEMQRQKGKIVKQIGPCLIF